MTTSKRIPTECEKCPACGKETSFEFDKDGIEDYSQTECIEIICEHCNAEIEVSVTFDVTVYHHVRMEGFDLPERDAIVPDPDALATAYARQDAKEEAAARTRLGIVQPSFA